MGDLIKQKKEVKGIIREFLEKFLRNFYHIYESYFAVQLGVKVLHIHFHTNKINFKNQFDIQLVMGLSTVRSHSFDNI